MGNLIKTTTKTASQAIADRIHYLRMVDQYHREVTNYVEPVKPADWDDEMNGPWVQPVPRSAEWCQYMFQQAGFPAVKLFLDCTEQEAIENYAIVSTHKGSLYLPAAVPVYSYDSEGEIIEQIGLKKAHEGTTAWAHPVKGKASGTWFITAPESLDDYDLSEFTFTVVEYSADLFPPPPDDI